MVFNLCFYMFRSITVFQNIKSESLTKRNSLSIPTWSCEERSCRTSVRGQTWRPRGRRDSVAVAVEDAIPGSEIKCWIKLSSGVPNFIPQFSKNNLLRRSLNKSYAISSSKLLGKFGNFWICPQSLSRTKDPIIRRSRVIVRLLTGANLI